MSRTRSASIVILLNTSSGTSTGEFDAVSLRSRVSTTDSVLHASPKQHLSNGCLVIDFFLPSVPSFVLLTISRSARYNRHNHAAH
mmetsp:Transcript_110935/g.227041  ORF Transcript_110935/g.227041 Transcript_110935/m.227041 type:complete len:85 (+) Transcript_110935:274-528(+)